MKRSSMTIPCVLALAAVCALGQTAWSHDPSGRNRIDPLGWHHHILRDLRDHTIWRDQCRSSGNGANSHQHSDRELRHCDSAGHWFPLWRYQFEVENTGHVVEVVYDPGSSIRLGKSVTDIYQLVQFHFHAPSEHTIDGQQYDAELHLVHKNILGQLVVVGVLLTSSPTAGTTPFDGIAMTAPLIPGTAGINGTTLNAVFLAPSGSELFHLFRIADDAALHRRRSAVVCNAEPGHQFRRLSVSRSSI